MTDFMTNDVIFAFTLTLLAGLATIIGGLTAYFNKSLNNTFLATSLGFSAGVMIYVSFVEIFPKAMLALNIEHSKDTAYLITTLAFFGGIIVIGIIDNFIPSAQNPHEPKDLNDLNSDKKDLLRMGMFSALAIGIHNFPEGLATFTAALQDPQLGIGIAFAIAIHNIPEGVAVAVPIYYATKNRKKALGYSALSGLSEPIGAFVGYLILRPFISDTIFGIVFASVAGIMVYISLDELLPTAKKYGKHHQAIYGLVAGMMVMALSLIIFI